jgi:hypothetical protein
MVLINFTNKQKGNCLWKINFYEKQNKQNKQTEKEKIMKINVIELIKNELKDGNFQNDEFYYDKFIRLKNNYYRNLSKLIDEIETPTEKQC